MAAFSASEPAVGKTVGGSSTLSTLTLMACHTSACGEKPFTKARTMSVYVLTPS